MTTTQDRGRTPFFPGFDALRLGGMLLVSAQHFLTLTGRHTWTTLWSLSLGSLGVAIFCALSGFLALHDQRPALQWLRRRCERLFPAYWIVLIVSFVLTWLFRYKSFDIWQVMAQFAGIGLFTHPDNLVNSATWFLSVLLVCYVLAFLVKVLHVPPGSMGLLAVALFVVLLFDDSFEWLGHVMTFCGASLGAMRPGEPRKVLRWLAVCCLVLSVWQHAMAYAGISLLLLAGAIGSRQLRSATVRVLSSISYEYYLLHGIVFVGCFRVLPLSPSLALLCAVFTSLLGAAALHKVTTPRRVVCNNAIERHGMQ